MDLPNRHEGGGALPRHENDENRARDLEVDSGVGISGKAVRAQVEPDNAENEQPSNPTTEENLSLLKELSIGTVVDGKYRVDEVLGRGAMGVVVAATHVHLKESVALKFLHAR